MNQGTSTGAGAFYTFGVYNDPSAWYHMVAKYDFTNSLAVERMVLYINGVRTYVDQSPANINADSSWNTSGTAMYIGKEVTSSVYASMMLAEIHMIDGQALDPDSFAERDEDSGEWIPKKYTGTYGTNGCYLKFDPSATNGIGHDHSGNGNNWTANNFSTTDDVLSDTPTSNFCVLNPKNTYNNNVNNGNLKFSQVNSNNAISQGTFGMVSGKWYWEIEATNIGNGVIGITHYDYPTQALYGCSNGYGIGFSPTLNEAYINSSSASSSYCSSPSAPSSGTYMVAYDADNRKMWIGVNGTWYTKTGGSAGNPGAGTNELFDSNDITEGDYIYRALIGGSAVTTVSGEFNFGQRPLTYTPPSGFNVLNTKKAAAVSIKKPFDNFRTVTSYGTTPSAWSQQQVTTGASSTHDGYENSQIIWARSAQSTPTGGRYNGFDFVKSLNEREYEGYSDWFVPSRYELEIAYYNLKPTTQNNQTIVAGDNPYAVPARSGPYTTTVPGQTSASAFQSGGAQAFAGKYWTSGEINSTVASNQAFDNQGNGSGYYYTNSQKYTAGSYFRAFRREPYTGSEPSIGSAYKGGYYAGLYAAAGGGTATHAIIVADKSEGQENGILDLAQDQFSTGSWWIKNRQGTSQTQILDSGRGATSAFVSPNQSVEQTYSAPSGSSVAWSWYYNSSSPSTNGFQMINYTGNSTSGRTISHSLGAVPYFMIIFNRNRGSADYRVYHRTIGGTKDLGYQSTGGQQTDSSIWNNTDPTSTVFTLGNGAGVNAAYNYTAYLWSEIPGYSRFTSYKGNGSSNGPFCYLGFRPAWVWVKLTDSGGYHWTLWDSVRGAYNVNESTLLTSSTAAESQAQDVEFLANGFKIVNGDAQINNSNSLYTVYAFAENAFMGSNVPPATAY